MKSLWLILASLPEIVKLLNNIQARIDKLEEDRKVKQDLAELNKAFEDNDAQALVDLFNK